MSLADRPYIDLRDVSKSFDGAQTFAVADVSLPVDRGSFVALVGTTGSGKSTLLKMINRLVVPDAGKVTIDGEDIVDADAPALRRRIGYVFQSGGLFPHMTVAENIGITATLLGWQARDIATRIEELLDLVELPRRYAQRNPQTLSGGERQRVAIARALAVRPSIVLMDEPLGALDAVTRDTVGTAYRTLHDKLGLTTIMVTHDMQEAVLLADHIAVMKSGRLLAYDTPRALMAAPSDSEVAALIGMPRRWAERIQQMTDRDGGPLT
jgi:osmoprotectant transport system ATP-binding protein